MDLSKVFPNPLDAQCVEGYFDGKDIANPEPGPNRHPAYIHGFMNGRDDIGIKHGQTAAQRRAKWDRIVATCGEDAR